MALPKLFERILWHNNTTPAINEDNLNAMSKGLSDVDDRVIELAGTIMEDVPAIQEYLEQADELVDQMEELSTNPPYIGSNGNWYVWDTNTGAYVDSNIDASITVAIADITMLAPTATPYVTNTGTNTDPIFHLYIPRGIGIASIQKTGTSGLVDTYTITYSDGYTDTFTVTNGKTAYQYAVDGGYSGTEADFYADLANFEQWKDDAEQGASDAEAYAKGTRSGTAVGSSDPAYHNNAQYFAGLSDTSAQASAGSATSAAGSASDSEAYGAGTRNGVPVSSSDPAYHNNAPYYAQQAAAQSLGGLSDVDIDVSTLAEGHIIAFDQASQKWKNTPIKAAVIQNVPSQSGSLTYNGLSQSPTWSNYDPNIMTIGGVTSGTNAGTYTATFTPAVGYCWSDYTTAPKSITWTIEQATGAVTLSKSSVTLDANTLTDTVTTTGATGDVSVSSSDTTVATATINNGVITISSVNDTTGTATITVTVAASADGNYTTGTATISITAAFYVPPTWAGGTDAEIVEALQKHYAGEVDLHEYWNVGDERVVTLGVIPGSTYDIDFGYESQSVSLVIMNKGGKELVTPINNHSECAFVVGQKDSLDGGGRIANGYTASDGWENATRRSWCNDLYKSAIPQGLASIFKQFKNECLTGAGQTTHETVYDYFSLAARAEILNIQSGAYTYEGPQFDYYKVEANRIKAMGTNTAYAWWTRTPNLGDTASWTRISDSGTASTKFPNDSTSGIAPFGCI